MSFAPAAAELDVGALRRDVETLAAMERGSASEGERTSARFVAKRLAQAGAEDVRVEPFRGQRTFAHAQGAHFATGLAAAAGGGAPGAALALASLVSFELDYSGRSQWLRRLLPSAEGSNAVGHVSAEGRAERTLVLVAHHDAAHTGLMWHPRLFGLTAERADRRDAADAFSALPEAALALAAAGSALGSRPARAAGAAVLAISLALSAEVARGDVVPGASDNATGVAAMLALVARLADDPLPGTDVIALSPGCEESGMAGMASWLAREGERLDPAKTLVLGLDTLGAGEPIVASAEGPVVPVRYRDADIAWADRGAELAGLPRPRRFRLGAWTDPVLARLAGLPTISLLSIRGGAFTNYHLPTDTPDRVDWGSVESCAALAHGVARAFTAA